MLFLVGLSPKRHEIEASQRLSGTWHSRYKADRLAPMSLGILDDVSKACCRLT